VLHSRRINLRMVIMWGLRSAGIGGSWALVVFLFYAYSGLEAVRLPFLPVATIGTAVAFYVGFKNNSSYERFWEGRKIWGGVVNASRTWGTQVMSYILPGDDGEEARALRRVLLYRHLAWTNALRLQLRKTTRFSNKPAPSTARRLRNHAEHMRNDWDKEMAPFLDEEELKTVSAYKNPATHLVRKQGDELSSLLQQKRLDLFHQIDLMAVLEELYTLQGKCERIKNTPFPRQYAEYSRMFTRVFVFLVPFGLLDVFAEQVSKATSTMETLSPVVPMFFSAALITWVFMTMEGLGDASEDPFERSMNDVPMNALCRTIEIDLREMLGETELPAKEQPIDGILY
jgi:putative membrane protein